MGTLLTFLVEGHSDFPGDGLFVQSGGLAQVKVIDHGPPLRLAQSFLDLVYLGLLRGGLRPHRLGIEVESFGYLERDARGSWGGGGGAPMRELLLDLSKSMIEDLKASLPGEFG